MKKVTIGSKPSAKSPPTSSDEWVSDSASSGEVMKRLTIDVTLSLHQRVKSQCALKGENMADAVRALLERHFGQDSPATAVPPVGDIQKHDSVILSNHDGDSTGT